MLERFTTQYCSAKLGRVSFLFHFMKNSFFEVTRLFTFVSQKNINLFFLQNKWHWKKMRQRIIIAYTWQWCWTCSCNMTPVMNFLLVELVSDGSLSGTNIVGCNGLHWKLLTMCYLYLVVAEAPGYRGFTGKLRSHTDIRQQTNNKNSSGMHPIGIILFLVNICCLNLDW